MWTKQCFLSFFKNKITNHFTKEHYNTNCSIESTKLVCLPVGIYLPQHILDEADLYDGKQHDKYHLCFYIDAPLCDWECGRVNADVI